MDSVSSTAGSSSGSRSPTTGPSSAPWSGTKLYAPREGRSAWPARSPRLPQRRTRVRRAAMPANRVLAPSRRLARLRPAPTRRGARLRPAPTRRRKAATSPCRAPAAMGRRTRATRGSPRGMAETAPVPIAKRSAATMCRRPSRSAEIWSTGVRADLGARVWMESKRPSATIGCAGPHVLLGFARQAFGGFFPALVGVVGLVRCR